MSFSIPGLPPLPPMPPLSPPVIVFMILVFAAAATAFQAMFGLVKVGSVKRRVNQRLTLAEKVGNLPDLVLELRKQRGLNRDGTRRDGWAWFNDLVVRSGVAFRPKQWAGITAGFAGAACLALTIVTHQILIGLVGAIIAGIGGPLFLLKFKAKKRARRLGEQLPGALEVVVRSLEAGHPVPTAIDLVGREMPDPIGSEFGMAADEIAFGATLEQAVGRMADRCRQPDMDLFAATVRLQERSGGNLVGLLKMNASVIRDRMRMRLKIAAASSEGRISALILTCAPICSGTLLELSSPNYYGAVIHERGVQISLVVMVVWVAIGNFIMRRMIDMQNLTVMLPVNTNLIIDMAAGLMMGGGALTAIVMLSREAAMAHRRGARMRGEARARSAGAAPAVSVLAKAAGRVMQGAGLVGNRMATRDPGELTVLRMKLIQAGFDSRESVPVYLGARVTALTIAVIGSMFLMPIVFGHGSNKLMGTAAVGALAVAGFLGPDQILKSRRRKRELEYREGFPDVLDLLVASVEAGLSLDSAISRVADEVSRRSPNLAKHIRFLTLELRAGRARKDAWGNLAERLGIDEARSFATMLRQAEQMGSSLGETLSVFAVEMRAKRMLRAEEKAMALPAKLVVPMILFIFPCLLATLMLPAVFNAMREMKGF